MWATTLVVVQAVRPRRPPAATPQAAAPVVAEAASLETAEKIERPHQRKPRPQWKPPPEPPQPKPSRQNPRVLRYYSSRESRLHRHSSTWAFHLSHRHQAHHAC